MIRIIGENATDELLKGAIFSITAGSNDILEHLRPSIPLFGGSKVPFTVTQDIMVSNLTLHLKVRMYDIISNHHVWRRLAYGGPSTLLDY